MPLKLLKASLIMGNTLFYTTEQYKKFSRPVYSPSQKSILLMEKYEMKSFVRAEVP
jgi:hypothetical protein